MRPATSAAVLTLFAFIVGACSPVRLIEAVDLLRGIAGPPRALTEGGTVRRSTDGYGQGEHRRRADLYVAEDAKAALLLVPGAAQEGWRDPRVVSFAVELAETGFAVLVPELAGEQPLQVSVADAEAIADAARHFSESAGVPDLGMAAVSYAVGPAVLAALRPDISDRIGFILAIGGYYDIVAAITYLTTGAYRTDRDSPWRFNPTSPSAKWLFLKANAGRVAPPDDRLLAAIAERKLAAPEAPVTDLVARLEGPGRSIHALLANRDPDRVPALIEDLPEDLREQILALDLSARALDTLEAQLILLHGRDDPMVPFTESLDLAHAAPPDRATVFVVDGLRHVDLETPAFGDLLTLLRVSYRLLAERDSLPEPETDMPDRIDGMPEPN